MKRSIGALAAVPLLAMMAAGCGDEKESPRSITLVAYSSFPTAGTSLNDALDEFTADTGIEVEIVTAGDAGTMVTKAVLTAGNPEGDVMWGVDNTLLSAAIDGDVFAGAPVQVDYGDVCVNYDIAWFADHSLDPPQTLAELIDPAYKDLLVVEDPTTSSPGLAFLLATIAAEGDGWQDYWQALEDNGVEVADSWDSAYYERFSGAAGSPGDRPLVVSYGSSPPAEVVFADPPRDDAPTGVSAGTCFRQEEYAGVLRGAHDPDGAQQLVEFLTSARFQQELPLNLFVYPANPDVALPDVFTRFAVIPDQPWTIDPDDIAANREQWQDEWHALMTD